MTGATLDPTFLPAALAAAERPRRQGAPPDAAEGQRLAAQEAGVSLAICMRPDDAAGTVLAAWHSGAGGAALRGVLDVFCQAIEGLPLQEAADHGALHALERLRGGDGLRPVRGILTTRSAGAAFALCERLVRSVLRQRQAARDERSVRNFWNPALSRDWRAKSEVERKAALQLLLDEVRAAEALAPGDLYLAEIEKLRRVIVGFAPGVSPERKPRLLMRIEQRLRQATGERLEVYMEEMKDNNQIRRLGPSEVTA